VSVPTAWLASPTEAEPVAALLVEFRDHLGRGWPSDNAFLAGVERLLGDDGTEYLLAASDPDSPPAGVCQLRYRWGLWHAAPDCCLEDLYVRPQARRRGIAAALVSGSLAHARGRGCRRIELDVNRANPAAMALYERFGFSAGAEVPGGENLLMRRGIEGA
jgi:ribosomal protein S18 acetylase RimI-like enzyme